MQEVSLWLESMGIPPLLGGFIAGAVMVWVLTHLGSGGKSAPVLGAASGSGAVVGNLNKRNPRRETTELDADSGEEQKANSHNLTDLELAIIFRYMQKGEKITAIKLARERTGMGLAEAKRFVEELDARGIGH